MSDSLQNAINAIAPGLNISSLVIKLVFAVFFIYLISYSYLQARQARLMQDKVKTDIDVLLSGFSWVYVFVQIMIFVVVLVIL